MANQQQVQSIAKKNWDSFVIEWSENEYIKNRFLDYLIMKLDLTLTHLTHLPIDLGLLLLL